MNEYEGKKYFRMKFFGSYAMFLKSYPFSPKCEEFILKRKNSNYE